MAGPGSGKNVGGGTRFGDSHFDSVLPTADRFGRPSGGTVIGGKYRLERILGEGGMGAVWRAHHLQLDLPVAIKLMRGGAGDPVLSERMKIEAQSAARLVHPAIVRVFDIDTIESGDPYIVMELLSGESLSDLFDRGRLSGISAVQTLLPIAEALALAHGKGVVHRDIKPHNVFLAEEGERLQPKLLDFGIAKLTQAPISSGALTATGVLVGSPDYMSPEQARGDHDVDFRADIWAFCVVLYEAVSGDIPFRGDNYNALMRAIVENETPPLRLDENVDQVLAELIAWGLSKDRSQRPGSMQELGRELARWLLDRGVHEDVCGSPLGPKWITRTAQKSVPVLQPADEAPEPFRPPPVVRTDTLVSPRLVQPSLRRPAPSEAPAEPPGPTVGSRRSMAWAAAGVALVVAAAAWGLATRAPAEPRVTPLSSGALVPAPDDVPTQAAPLPAPSAPAATFEASPIASTAPAPPPTMSAQPSSGSSPINVKSASPPAPAAQLEEPKARTATSKATPAKQPIPDASHRPRELLQAY